MTVNNYKLEELFTMLSESDKEAVPRIIIVKNNKLWREEITSGVNQDISIFKSNNFVVTCKRHLDDELESNKFKGDLYLALHNALTYLDETDNMIITVENIISKFVRGAKASRTIKLVYIVIHS